MQFIIILLVYLISLSPQIVRCLRFAGPSTAISFTALLICVFYVIYEGQSHSEGLHLLEIPLKLLEN
jgi:hypothetical protein